MQLLDAAAYISKQFKYIGLSVDERELPVKAFKCDNVEVKIDFPENKIIKSKVLTFSKETPKEGLSSEIVNGYIGTESDLEKAQVKDKLVVIQRGGDTFRNNTEIAAACGAYISNGKLIPGDAKYVCNISGLKNNPDNLVSYSLKFLI